MPDKIIVARFEFILESVTIIQIWFEDIKAPEDFLSSSLGRSHYDATLMRLQSIGESLKKIEKTNSEIFNRYPQVEWHEIIRLREIISHHYEQLSHEIVFNICKINLPVLKKSTESIIEDLKKY